MVANAFSFFEKKSLYPFALRNPRQLTTWWNDFEVYACKLNFGIFLKVHSLAFQFKDALIPSFWVKIFFLPREYYGFYIEKNNMIPT